MTAYSAFGVKHTEISKANDSKEYASPQRLAAGAAFPGVHGAVAGRKGRKLRAAGNELGGGLVGGVASGLVTNGGPGLLAGAAAGTARAHKQGHYKPDRGSQRTGPIFGGVTKSAASDAGKTLVHVGRAAPRGGKAGYRVTSEEVLGRMSGSRRGEFTRGLRGGTKGTFVRGVIGHQQPRMRQNARAGYRAAANNQRKMSTNPGAFRAGERVGAGAGSTAAAAVNHPKTTVYGGMATVGGGAVANDVRRARKQNTVAKASRTRELGGVLVAAGAAAGAATEGKRRYANRHGAQVSAMQRHITHPYKSGYAENAAINRHRAERLQAKADATGNEGKKARLNDRANRFRWSSGNLANAAREGGVASATAGSNRGNNTYRRDRHYDAPAGTIRVAKADSSAFGVDHPGAGLD